MEAAAGGLLQAGHETGGVGFGKEEGETEICS